MNRYRLDYYFRKQFMRDFVFDSALIRAEDDTVAVAHALRKMNKKAGDKGMYQQQRLVRLD